MCRQPPTLGNQPTPEHDQDGQDGHHDKNLDGHDHDDDHPNLIGESGVEIRKLGDHQQPRGRTLSKLFKVLLVKHFAQLVFTSVFECAGQLMVVVLIVVIVVVVAVAIVVVLLLLQHLIVVAQLEA